MASSAIKYRLILLCLLFVLCLRAVQRYIFFNATTIEMGSYTVKTTERDEMWDEY
jgi:hypothetical protein